MLSEGWDANILMQSEKAFKNADFNEAKRLPLPTSSLPSVESLVSALASVDLHPSYERVTVNRLTDGRNQGKAVIGKVLCSVQNPGKIPLYYVVCDSEQTCFVITVYGIRSTAFPENKELLCHLSVVERRLCRDTEDEKAEEIIGESIKHARKAISMDVNDGISWYALGNAYLTAYFVTGCWDVTMLQESLKAYKNAAKDKRIKLSPYMFYNCAMTYKFMETYQVALEGFNAAGLREGGHSAQEQESNLFKILDEIVSLLQDLNKAKRLPLPASSIPAVDSLASSLASVDLDPSYKKVTVDSLKGGLNLEKAVTGKVMFSVKNPNNIPSYYVVRGSDRKCFVITVYSVCSTAIKEEDEVTLLDPNYHFFDIESKGKRYQFKSLRVDLPRQLRVNGAIVSPEHLIHSSMCPPTHGSIRSMWSFLHMCRYQW